MKCLFQKKVLEMCFSVLKSSHDSSGSLQRAVVTGLMYLTTIVKPKPKYGIEDWYSLFEEARDSVVKGI